MYLDPSGLHVDSFGSSVGFNLCWASGPSASIRLHAKHNGQAGWHGSLRAAQGIALGLVPRPGQIPRPDPP